MTNVRLAPPSETLYREVEESFPEPIERPAVFFFSMAKCGSTMLTKAVKYCLEARGLPGFHFARFFWERGVVKSKWSRYDLRPFVRDGIVYYGFRSLPHFLAHSSLLQNRKSILLVRDPRDAATSHYFSKLYEHPVPGQGQGPAARKFLMEREKLQNMSIDDHVLRYSKTYLSAWTKYIENLPVQTGHSKIYRYEDIIFNKRAFFRDAFQFLEIDVPEGLIDKIVSKVDVFPQEEQVNKRIRVVKPGNHLEKLKPQTIEKLNELLHAPLNYHGYI